MKRRRFFAAPTVTLLLPLVLGCGTHQDTPTTSGSADSGIAPIERIDSQSNTDDISSDDLLKMAIDKLDAKQYDEAIRLFTTLADRVPTATNFAFIGDCYWKQRELEQADIHYRRALEVDPRHCGANHALGRNAVLQGQYQDALAYLDTAREVCDGTVLHSQNLRFRVEALLELDRLIEAESDLERLVTKYPDDANTHEAGMLVATKKGDDSLAAEYKRIMDAESPLSSEIP